MTAWQRGDLVIFRMTKRSAHPGPRARDVTPEPLGEDYTYTVDKFWIVADVAADGTLLLRTRQGKEHRLPATHPNLRKASWWERLLYRDRYHALLPQLA